VNGPEPKEYQSEAIVKIADALTTLLAVSESEDRLVILKAPTGSGKTLVTAYALAKTHDRPQNPPFIVLWLSPGRGNLHKQSARTLTSMLANSSLAVKLLESRDDIVANSFPVSGTVFVVNWEKLRTEKNGEWGNKMLREGETANLFTLLTNTTEQGMDMVVVIDESHTQLDGAQTMKLMAAIKEFRPYIQLEVSATPTRALDEEMREEGIHHAVVIPFRKVEKEGMVRRSVLLNPDFEDVQAGHATDALDVQVLWAAWERIELLTSQYAAVGSAVKPLLLIQYPDGAEARPRADIVEAFLGDRGLESDVTYATWLTEEHSPNLDLIARQTSPYRALIFKQAIATGWDCPRAQVLVQFRKPGSDTFQIQTLGRLMRTPEQKHYEDEDLNVAYVYSDLAGVSVKITSDEPDFMMRDTTIHRGPQYPPAGIKLRSIFQPRKREFHYPTVATLEPALKAQLDQSVAPLLGSEPIQETRQDVLVDGEIDAKDVVGGASAEFDGAVVDGILSAQFVQALFDQVLTSRIGPYGSREQSRSRIKTLIIKWFQATRDWQPDEIQHFVLAHAGVVSDAIDAACHTASVSDEAQALVDARLKRRVTEDWEIPLSELIASSSWEVPEAGGSLFEPAFVPIGRSKPEKRFEHWLGEQFSAGVVTWWWKNGVRDEKYLGVPYVWEDHGTGKTSDEITYPDYLIMTAMGDLWVIEVKDINDPDGYVGGTTSSKATGLQTWANEINALRKVNPELIGLAPIRTKVAVPVDTGGGKIIVKQGSPEAWQAPTPANHSTGTGWTDLDFNAEE